MGAVINSQVDKFVLIVCLLCEILHFMPEYVEVREVRDRSTDFMEIWRVVTHFPIFIKEQEILTRVYNFTTRNK